MRRKGFTLIELLVVIAIIALLLAVLMPSLRRAKEAGKRIQCINNAKTLALGMMMYVEDYEQRLPRARTGPNGWLEVVAGHPMDPENASKELQLEAIRSGLLYTYVNNPAVYRCSMARRNEFRTFSMTHAMNGGGPNSPTFYGGEIVRKITQVSNREGRIMFIDDYISDWDATWMVFNNQHSWWNAVPIRHGSGGNVFSFVDGHADFHIWKDKRTVELGEKCAEMRTPETSAFPSLQRPVPNNEDLIWAQRATWGTLGYTPTP